MPFTYEFARAALTVDVVVFAFEAGVDEPALQVMLIERDVEPFAGRWALPGGFVRLGETLEEAARRELEEETGLRGLYLEQLQSFGALDRDPRERVVSVAHYALANLEGHDVRATTDARSAAWFPAEDTPELAFDHAEILRTALDRLRAKLRYRPVGFELLPEAFPLRRLQALYEGVLGRPLDKRNFRKKILAMGVLAETGATEEGVKHRAAKLYRFDRAAYERLTRGGFHFEL